MTPENDTPVARTRRDVRTPAPSAASRVSPPTPQRWSRKRSVLTTFSIVAAVGFAAAYITPTVSALASGGPQTGSAPSVQTAYDAAMAGAQTFSAHDDAVQADVTRDGGYTVYVTPTPTPTPEPVAQSSGSSSAGVPVMRYSGGGSPADWMAAAGISAGDSGYVDYIVSRESGWNPNATNSSPGACGLVQALPCSKVPGGGYNPVANLQWANGYAVGRYGSWAAAYDFWVNNHWW